jgi:hypothetical protein
MLSTLLALLFVQHLQSCWYYFCNITFVALNIIILIPFNPVKWTEWRLKHVLGEWNTHAVELCYYIIWHLAMNDITFVYSDGVTDFVGHKK